MLSHKNAAVCFSGNLLRSWPMTEFLARSCGETFQLI